jgi:general secretion pathway protein B
MVWQLSLTQRQALPPLKLSMHVWNRDPARRFVILDGARLAEGQSNDKDVGVIEIRRDGVLLQHRGARFVLPRGGL